MSGFNSRKIYDNCYTTEFIDQQVNPCKYRTYPPYGESNAKCHTLNGPRSNMPRGTGELGDTDIVYRTDIESQLFNLDIPDARCITLKTMKEKNERLAKIAQSKKINYTLCGENQDTIYSRLDIPVNKFRSAYFNTYGFPIINPGEFVYYGTPNTNQVNNQRWGVNTQLQAKDTVNPPNMFPSSNLTF